MKYSEGGSSSYENTDLIMDGFDDVFDKYSRLIFNNYNLIDRAAASGFSEKFNREYPSLDKYGNKESIIIIVYYFLEQFNRIESRIKQDNLSQKEIEEIRSSVNNLRMNLVYIDSRIKGVFTGHLRRLDMIPDLLVKKLAESKLKSQIEMFDSLLIEINTTLERSKTLKSMINYHISDLESLFKKISDLNIPLDILKPTQKDLYRSYLIAYYKLKIEAIFLKLEQGDMPDHYKQGFEDIISSLSKLDPDTNIKQYVTDFSINSLKGEMVRLKNQLGDLQDSQNKKKPEERSGPQLYFGLGGIGFGIPF